MRQGRHGFTLLELSVVLVLIALVLAGGLVTLTANVQTSQFNTTVAKMDVIEKALLDYSTSFSRLPCPSNLTLTASDANYGIEAANQGTCTGGTPAANNIAVSGTAEGGVPTRTLQLSDDYMYDGWGRRIRYAVDKANTTTSSLPATSVCTVTTTPNTAAITVKDAVGGTRTSSAAYALISHGVNGHGAYSSNGAMVNAGSLNTDELTNCHCTSAGVAGTYTPTYIQKYPVQNSASALNNFDDIVTYKDAWQLQSANAPLVAAVCNQVIAIYDQADQSRSVFTTSGTLKFRKTGSPETGTTFQGYCGLAFDNSGVLWVADGGNHRTLLYNTDGSFKQNISHVTNAGAEGPIIINQANNHVFVQDGYTNAINEGDNTGAFIQTIGGTTLSSPVPGAIDSSGISLWVADSGHNRIVKYTISTALQTQVVPSTCTTSCSASATSGQFNNPADVKLDGAGNIFVADYGNNRVTEFDPTGTTVIQNITTWTTSGAQTFSNVAGLAFDSTGALWVADYNGSRVIKFTISGATATYAQTIPASCANAPCGAAYNNDGLLSNPTYLSIGTVSAR